MNASDPSDIFRQEASDLLEQLQACLLDLERRPDDAELIDSAFRALHTIKGSGSMFGFTQVAEFVHEFETAFDRLRRGNARIVPAMVTVALEARDHIEGLIAGTATQGGDEILVRLRSAMAAPQPAQAEAAPAGPGRWRLQFHLPPDALVNGTNPALLIEELSRIGEIEVGVLLDRLPPLGEFDAEECRIGWQVDLVAEDPQRAIDDVFMFLRDEMELSLAPLPAEGDAGATPEAASAANAKSAGSADGSRDDGGRAPAAAPAAPPPAGPAGSAAPAAASSLRVSAEKLDELMDRVGELVIAQARLSQIAAAGEDATVKTVAEDLERLAAGLRDTAMGIRMVPFGSLFGRFRRLVHDLSRELGKPIEFVTSGEDTELDKTVIEKLGDPLVHVIRNSVDHGLEDPARRAAAGKPANGKVQLSARYAGAEVVISITDDGAGLDPVAIRARAEANGLIAPDARLSDEQLYQLVFAPGFSTAREVTSLSGRGVGMDVVRRTIEELRGAIELTSNPGIGTTVAFRLPLTLAIIDGMQVRVGSGRYVVPLAAVEECVELPNDLAATAGSSDFLDIRGKLVPFLRLQQVFSVEAGDEPFQKVVIVSSAEGRVGLVVDQIIGNSQIVIKQLSRLHAGSRSFSGATIMGDGTVALILDTAHLVAVGQPRGAGRRMSGRVAA